MLNVFIEFSEAPVAIISKGSKNNLAWIARTHVVIQPLSHVQLCNPIDCSMPGLPCPSLSPGVCSNSCPLSHWCHPTISSLVASFSSYPQSFPASGSFPMIWLFASGGQSIRASASVFQTNIQGWFSLGLTACQSYSKSDLCFSF